MHQKIRISRAVYQFWWLELTISYKLLNIAINYFAWLVVAMVDFSALPEAKYQFQPMFHGSRLVCFPALVARAAGPDCWRFTPWRKCNFRKYDLQEQLLCAPTFFLVESVVIACQVLLGRAAKGVWYTPPDIETNFANCCRPNLIHSRNSRL